MKLIELAIIEPERSKEEWISWLAQESGVVRKRFGSDSEAIHYFPDDYYDKMEQWWASDRREIDPVTLSTDSDGIVRIVDGWHRVAISHKIGLTYIPAIFDSP